MTLDRRQFLEITGLGTAGLLAGCTGESQQSTADLAAAPAAPQRTGASGATLKLLLWGSCVYAFSPDGHRVTVAYLTTDPTLPGCTFVPHHPVMRLLPGGARIDPARTTIASGGDTEIAMPAGAFRIAASSLAANAGSLKAIGLKDPPSECAAPVPSIDSLSFIPTLAAARGVVAHNWHDRFATRLLLESGELRATQPFHAEKELARWHVKGPAGTSSVALAFTDTLLLTVPLAGDSVTFESEDGKTLTLTTSGNPAEIEAILMAHPPDDEQVALKPGDREPHFCSLYAIFDSPPAQADRAELFFKDWCQTQSPVAPAPGSLVTGPSPGRYCTGGKIIL